MTSVDHERALLDLLERLLDAEPSERQSQLQRLDQEDPTVAQRIRSLLADMRTDPGNSLLEDMASAQAVDLTGQMLGPYQLHERLGQGGMGDVWRASRSDGAFEREVAIKRVWAGTGRLTERFLQERQLLARLQHVNIAQLLDGGVDAHGQPWFAMELVDGAPITRWCDARNAGLDARIQLFLQLCHAVQFAHANLVVHRDIKPANVLVGDAGVPKLLDFGIAKLLGDADSEHTQTLAMTPAWATPEQRRGDPVTIASDIYQLGALLRLLLSGVAATLANRSQRVSVLYGQLLASDAERARTLAQQRGGLSPEQLRARLQGDLDSIVLLATAERPDERYPSVQTLADDLQRWLRREPVQARGDERGYRMRRWLRRWWPALAAGVAALGFLGYHLVSLKAGLQRERAATAAAVLAREDAERQRNDAEMHRDKAMQLADSFSTLFQEVEPREIAEHHVDAGVLLERSVQRLQRDADMDPVVRAELLGAAADALRELGRHSKSMQAHVAAVQILESEAHPDPDELVRAYARIGLAADFIGDSTQARQWLDKGLRLVDTQQAREPDALLTLEQLQANMAWAQNDLDQARASYRHILEITRPHLRLSRLHGSHVAALVNLARITPNQNEAEQLLRRADAMQLEQEPINRRTLYATRAALLMTLMKQDKDDQAAALAEPLLAEAERYFTANEPWLGYLYSNIGRLDLKRRQLTSARQRLDRAWSIMQANYGPESELYRRTGVDAVLGRLLDHDQVAADDLLQRLQSHPTSIESMNKEERDLREGMLLWMACLHHADSAHRVRLQAWVAQAATQHAANHDLYRFDEWASRCVAADTPR